MRTLYSVAAVATVFAVLCPTASPLAIADDPVVYTVTLQGELTNGSLTFTSEGVINAVQLDAPLQSECGMSLGEGSQLCVGAAVSSHDPIVISGPTIDPFVRTGGETADALRWIVNEAVQAIRSYYDVPLDYRIERYAAAEVRAYMQNRIIDIFDKVAYAKPLTEDEAFTFQFIQRQVLELDRRITGYAYEEYEKWKNAGCGYLPPSAPSWVAEPVVLPDDVRQPCLRAQNFYDVVFTIAKPSPTVQHFITWGMYRNAAALGLDDLDMQASQNQMLQSVAAGVVLGGIATAIAAAGATAAIVGSSAALSAAATAAMGSFAATSTALGVYGPAGVAAAFASVGPAAAATVVGIILLGIVVTAVSIVMVVENEQIGATLLANRDKARKATDPFGLIPLANAQAGLELREGMTASTLPSYRKSPSLARIMQFISQWTSFDANGQFYPDATGLWSDSATSPDDYQFEVQIDGAPATQVESISVPVDDSNRVTVRFNRSWMIVTPEGEQPRAALSFGYINENGNVAYASRRDEDSGVAWVVTRERENGAMAGARASVIRFHDADGRLISARIISPPREVLGGLRPTAVGAFTPQRPVMLRPNPVSEAGHFLLDEFLSDYAYEWDVTRFDTPTQSWVTVPTGTPAGYGTSFVPDELGHYRALVTMRHVPGERPDTHGLVQFEIAPPTIVFDELSLNDDGDRELELRFQFSEKVPRDTFEVTIEWPGAFGEGPVTDNFTVECLEGVTCQSQPLTRAHELDWFADTADGVRVTVVNSFGSAAVRVLPLESSGRVAFAPPINDPDEVQLGTVEFVGNSANVQMPVQVDGNTVYELATIVPVDDGQEFHDFGIYDPVTDQSHSTVFPFGSSSSSIRLSIVKDDESGKQVLLVSGSPTLDELGLHEIPIVVRHLSPSTFSQSAFLVRLDVVAAPEDRYRSVLLGGSASSSLATDTLPKFETQVLGGQSGWGEVTERVCLGLERLEPPFMREEKCGAHGEFFDEEGRPYRFPYEELFPHGVPTGYTEVSSWLPEEGDRVTSLPFAVRFRLQTGPPTIDSLTWNAAERRVRLIVNPAPDTVLESVTCTLDGVEKECFDDSLSVWSPGALSDGPHELVVIPRVDSGNYTTGTLHFTVSSSDNGPGRPVVPVPGAPGNATDPSAADSSDADPEGHGEPETPDADPAEQPSPSPEAPGGGDETPGSAGGEMPALGTTDAVAPILWTVIPAMLLLLALGTSIWVLRRRAG